MDTNILILCAVALGIVAFVIAAIVDGVKRKGDDDHHRG